MYSLAESIKLAIARLRHQPFQFLCLVCFTSAVILPILLIAGLRHGIVSNLRHELIANPRITEVQLFGNTRLSKELIENIAAWPEVGFILPKTRLLGAPVSIAKLGKKQNNISYDIIATAAKDPLLLRYHIAPPREGEVVLSYNCASEMSLRYGEQIELSAWRNNKQESQQTIVRIAGILPEGASKSQIYAPLQLCEKVEEFIESRNKALITQNKLLRHQKLYQSIILTEHTTGEEQRIKKLFAHKKNISIYDPQQDKLPRELEQCRLLRHGSRVIHGLSPIFSIADIEHYASDFEAHGYSTSPWNPPLSITDSEGSTFQLITALLDKESYSRHLPAQPQFKSSLPACKAQQWHIKTNSPLIHVYSELVTDLTHDASIAPNTLIASPALRALLNLAQTRPLRWDYRDKQGVRPLRQDYASLRLYAKHPRYSKQLADKLKEIGIECEVDSIAYQEVEKLDRQLGELFLLIAIISASGGALALSLSLFNTTESRRKSYAILLSLGMSRYAVALIPLWESLCTIITATLFSLIAFSAISAIIELNFSQVEQTATNLCSLTPEHWLQLLIISLTAATLAAIFSCMRILYIAPAESLKEN